MTRRKRKGLGGVGSAQNMVNMKGHNEIHIMHKYYTRMKGQINPPTENTTNQSSSVLSTHSGKAELAQL